VRDMNWLHNHNKLITDNMVNFTFRVIQFPLLFLIFELINLSYNFKVRILF
jgi:hypothetical protein